MQIEQIDIALLKLDPENEREHPAENLKDIKNSLKLFGQQSPLTIDENNIVLKGNGTLLAAKELGWKQIWVHRTALTERKAKAYKIADNRSGEKAKWNRDLLSKSLENLKDEFSLDELGFDDSWIKTDIIEGQIDDDEVPEAIETRCKPGDLWILGEHRLLCGDSTNVQHIERLMGGEKADMVYTDPPYGINESAAKRASRETNSITKSNHHLKEFKDDSIQYAIDAYNICQALNIPRHVWWGANYYCHALPQSNNWFVWDKRVEDKQKDTNSDCELAWVKSKWSSIRIFRHLWKGLMKDSERGQARVHPTQKPVELAIWAFDYFKDVKSVLDLFLGSGSTLIACEKTGRKCFGMEIDPHYCDIILARWEKFTGKTAVLSGDESRNGK